MSKLQKIIRLVLYLSVFLIPFYFLRFRIAGIPTNPLEISIIFAFILQCVDHIVSKKKLAIYSIDWTIILFLFFALIAVSISEDKATALGILKGWFIVPSLLYFSARESFSKRDVHKLVFPLFLSLMIVTVWSILQKFGVISTLFYQRGDTNFDQYLFGNVRLFGPFESPNYLAMFIVPSFYLSISLISVVKKYWIKILFIFLSLLPLYVLYYTKSRGGLLALSAGLVIYLSVFFMNKYSLYRSTNLKTIVALVMTCFAFLVYRLGFNQARDFSRIEIYRYDWSLIKSHFVTGIGFGSFQQMIDVLSSGNERFRAEVLQYAVHPHNLFLAVWLWLGIGGLVVFLILLGQFYFIAFNNLKEKTIIFPIAAMTAFLAHGLVDTTYFKNDLSALFFLVATFTLIVSQNEKSRR